MRLVGRSTCLDLNGPTTCCVIDASQRDCLVAALGPDPLAQMPSAATKKAAVWEAIRHSKKPIGALLLDQSVVAGVGNIFRAELFFELGLNPLTPGNAIDSQTFRAIWKTLTQMMRTGLKYGKIVTVTAKEAGAPRAKLEGGRRFRIYGKLRCPKCDGKVDAMKVASRKLYWCPECQGSSKSKVQSPKLGVRS
jgi:endonuclease-8